MAAEAEDWVAPCVHIKKCNSELTEDLIIEILVRLPIKKLARCKTVCKKWLSLISSHSFAFRHFQSRTFRKQQMIPAFFVLCSQTTEAFFAHVSFSVARKLTRHPRINLPYIQPWIGGIWRDGMVSYQVFSAGYGIYCLFETLTKKMLLWNPTTKEHKVLPPSPYVPPYSRIHAFSFGAVVYKDGNFFYNVCRVSSKLTPNSIYNCDTGGHMSVTLELYSSRTNSWKVIPDFASGQYFKYLDNYLPCANLNGRAHWVFQSATEEEEDTYITTFDYETELFGRIKAPPQIGGCSYNYNKLRCLVTTFHDKFLCLGLYREIHGKGYFFIDIWVMRKYGDEHSWIKKSTLGPIPDNLEVVEFSSKLKGLFLRNASSSYKVLLFWNCKSRKITGQYSMTEKIETTWVPHNLQVVEHAKSLVPILN